MLKGTGCRIVKAVPADYDILPTSTINSSTGKVGDVAVGYCDSSDAGFSSFLPCRFRMMSVNPYPLVSHDNQTVNDYIPLVQPQDEYVF